jgi:hypothetical protein
MWVMLPSAASAREYYYYHKPDVSRERYAADRLVCDKLAGGVVAPGSQLTTIYVPQYSTLSPGANAASVAIVSLFAGLLIGDGRKPIVNAVERTCMADKGYARYKVDKGMVQAIEALPAAEARVERYFTLATAPTPAGTRIKE